MSKTRTLSSCALGVALLCLLGCAESHAMSDDSAVVDSGAVDSAFDRPLDGGEHPVDAAGDAGLCVDLAEGSCPETLICFSCSHEPIFADHVCTTSCTSDSDCPDSARPRCYASGFGGPGSPGMCASSDPGCAT